MKRPASAENNLTRIQQWRQICPEITLRSTFIVGFPGETEADFETLLQFLESAQLDRVGCFMYSPVEGAAANALPDAVPEEIKQERLERFMQVQERISQQRLARKVGSSMTVLIDYIEDGQAIARSSADAPEIDGIVYINNPLATIQTGDFVTVEITDSDEHDLFAQMINT